MNYVRPDEFLYGWWLRIPRRVKLVFCFALAVAFLTHLFVFVNKLPNHDDLTEFTLAVRHNLSLGRWFRNVIYYLGGRYSTPLVRGTLSVFMLSAAATTVVSMLRVRSLLNALLIAGLFVTAPVTASMFSFMFMSDAFQFAMLATALSIFAARRGGRSSAAAAVVLLTLAIGTYQAAFFTAGALVFVIAVTEAAEGTESESFARTLRCLWVMAVSLLLYLVVTKTVNYMLHTQLSSYQSLRGINGGLLLELLRHPFTALASVYSAFLRNYFIDPTAYDSLLSSAARFGIWGIGLFFAFSLSRGIAGKLFCAVAALLSPLFFCSIYLLAPQLTFIHPVMFFYTELMAYVLILRLADIYESRAPRSALSVSALWGCALMASVLLYSGYLYANETYLRVALGYEKAYAFSNRLLTHIEALGGSKPVPIIFIGDVEAALDNTRMPTTKKGLPTSAFDGAQLVSCNRYEVFLRDYLGSKAVSSLGSSVEADNLLSQPEIASMPVYPAKGSIINKYGMIIVKFSETPKSLRVREYYKKDAEKNRERLSPQTKKE